MPPTDCTRALETLLAQIRSAGNVLLNVDMWERWGAQHASADERARMEAEAATATSQRAAARTALAQLVAATRRDAPDEVLAWADAHDAYLAAFLDDCAAKGEAAEVAASVATDERAAWGEVRAGTRDVVDENPFYVTLNAERYRALFGIEPDQQPS